MIQSGFEFHAAPAERSEPIRARSKLSVNPLLSAELPDFKTAVLAYLGTVQETSFADVRRALGLPEQIPAKYDSVIMQCLTDPIPFHFRSEVVSGSRRYFRVK